METIEEIWADDFLGRRPEAEDLIGYLESVASRPPLRDDGHAHVLAVDAAYGQGKSFFLRRFVRHMRTTGHAVAFVDAWVDDLEDEPLVALAATLEEALKPWTAKSKTVADRMARFRAKAGRVATIVGMGLARRAVGLLITQGAVDAAGEVVAGADEVSKDVRTDALKGAGSGIADDAATALGAAVAPPMESRIQRFREGKAAIREMREGLAEVVRALAAEGMQLPVTIVIDELDRCRPTYAIKLLEEVKHLFDVSGVAFVLGLHGEQLSHSVKAAYGSGFDGAAYLRRFFNRRYTLREAELKPLIEHLVVMLGIADDRFIRPRIEAINVHGQDSDDTPSFIAAYMRLYGLKARDAFELMEMLQTGVALSAPHKILLPYLLPLLIGHIKSEAGLPPVVGEPDWRLALDFVSKKYGPEKFASDIDLLAKFSDQKIRAKLLSKYDPDLQNLVVNCRFINPDLAHEDESYARPENYRRLLQTVKRFTTA
ncbi:KAP family NTPase [Sphingomonas canadensis]|uniref:KAP family NTPase n=1 Tax=Sphingomonas canadensis TaxID=1219257 RepID=A0ABW3H2J9_9SPHN|nr:KAP family NTPase [Sphingomonas canadensis]MCW3834497.1 KAP family NTPase [Sphingomonas canadensis]